ncbi:MAG TPA: zf-HC2 domain-containing protein [Ilumatobacter sp.]|nr:zf-HC2 domain-containing protein [Ilumatobacter sp.]
MTVNSGTDGEPNGEPDHQMIESSDREMRDIDCRHAVELMSDYLDGRLDAGHRARLERHLAECPYCVEYLAQLRVVIEALGRAQPGDLSEEALAGLVQVYREWKR